MYFYKRIKPGKIESPTIIMSDKSKSYTKIGKDKRYKHLTVNHSKNFVDPISVAHTQPIERKLRSAQEKKKLRRGRHKPHLMQKICFGRICIFRGISFAEFSHNLYIQLEMNIQALKKGAYTLHIEVPLS
ncbi:hypothetical protein HZS_1173 [Henneguya salminicola]|nr:hypothetical protein HZS_1173 [Henneguya salminicola]